MPSHASLPDPPKERHEHKKEVWRAALQHAAHGPQNVLVLEDYEPEDHQFVARQLTNACMLTRCSSRKKAAASKRTHSGTAKARVEFGVLPPRPAHP